jgi:hypothetical protein
MSIFISGFEFIIKVVRLRLEFLNISLKVINSMLNYISMLNFLFIQIIGFEIIFLFYFKDYNYGKVVFIVKISSLIIVCYALFFVNLFLETFICLIINFIIEACFIKLFYHNDLKFVIISFFILNIVVCLISFLNEIRIRLDFITNFHLINEIKILK